MHLARSLRVFKALLLGMAFSSAALAASGVPAQDATQADGARAGYSYSITEDHVGDAFLQNFDFEAIRDPTRGRVNYVDRATALREGLVEASSDSFILRADDTTVLAPASPGRNSVRLKSKRAYGYDNVMVFDIRHMPEGCGTWPAVWTVGTNWPNRGELDILEGVNDQGPNQVTIHTNAGCAMPGYRLQTGTPSGNNCDVAATNNAGCGVKVNDARSYGPLFNANDGGWYAVERTERFVKTWFFPRSDENVPREIKEGGQIVHPLVWGTPSAYFPSSSMCDLGAKFGPQNVVINLTFCGDWAGAVYGASGCPSTCIDYVNNNPGAFSDAYFEIASLRVYE